MKKQTAKISLLTLCAAAVLAVPALSRAQNNANPPVTPTPPPAVQPPAAATPPAAEKPAVKKRATSSTLPFHGKVAALDTNAMTLTVGQRTFNITSGTTITKDGKPAVLADGAVDEPVSGAYKKNAEGKLDATTIHFGGAKPAPKKESTGN